MTKLHIVEVEVLGEVTNGYRLKVDVLDLGLHMWGFRAQKSDKSKSGWWIQPPATKTPSGWKKNPEFDTHKTLWQEIEDECYQAINLSKAASKSVYSPSDEELTDEAISKSLDDVFPDKKSSSKAIPWMNADD